MKVQCRAEVQFPFWFLALATDWGEWLAPQPGRFISGMDPVPTDYEAAETTVSFGTGAEISPPPPPMFKPHIVQPAASHYTDCINRAQHSHDKTKINHENYARVPIKRSRFRKGYLQKVSLESHQYTVKEKLKLSRYRSEHALGGFGRFRLRIFITFGTMKVVRSSPLRNGRLYPQKYPGTHF
jgi:hypothetical protein